MVNIFRPKSKVGLLIGFCLICSSCVKDPENSAPIASFRVFPYAGDSTTAFILDPGSSFDPDGYSKKLTLSWDWNSDGIWDSVQKGCDPIARRFTGKGIHRITIQLVDKYEGFDITIDSIYIFQKPVQGTMTDPRDKRTYKTVYLANQWWMAESLKYGKLIPIDSAQKNNDVIEMYAYENNLQMMEEYGGLYTWDEAMQYSNDEGFQGICPPGWHIPSRKEWESFSKSIPYLFLLYYYDSDGTGGLGLDYAGYIVRFYQQPDKPDIRNRSIEFMISSNFWTSSHAEFRIQNPAGKTANVRNNYAVGINKVEVNRGSNDMEGFRLSHDWIHIYGNQEVYESFQNYPINTWYAFYVRCIAD